MTATSDLRPPLGTGSIWRARGSWRSTRPDKGSPTAGHRERGREDRAEIVQVPAVWERTHPDAEGVGFYRRVFTVPSRLGAAGAVSALRGSQLPYRGLAQRSTSSAATRAPTPRSGSTRPRRRGSAPRTSSWCGSRASRGPATSMGSPCSRRPPPSTAGTTSRAACGAMSRWKRFPCSRATTWSFEPDLRQEAADLEIVIRNAHPSARHGRACRSPCARPRRTRPRELARARRPSRRGSRELTYRLDLPRPQRWSCESPHLYRLRDASSRTAARLSIAASRSFGMRDFAVRDGQFFLNDEPIYLRGVLLQPNYPVGLIAPPTREMMEREIRLMKEAGFNMIRAHIRPAPPGYLDLTDEMGMLVYAESSLAWIRESPRWLDHASREIRAHDRAGPQPSVRGDLGHPQRESRGERRHQRRARSRSCAVSTRRGSWSTTPAAPWRSTRILAGPIGPPSSTAGETERQPIQDLHIYIGAPVPHGVV